MRKVAIVTDSTCCLPPELVEQYDIRLQPIFIIHKGRSYRDGVDITPTEVYQIMRRRMDLPTTSTPSVGDFLDTYRDLSDKAESILCITLTSVQSKTFEAAFVARERAREVLPNTPIEVLDSRAVSGALGFTAVAAARAVSEGADLAGAVEAARDMMGRVNFLAMVDTLYFLARTGRIGRATSWAGTMLNLKPIVEHSPAVGELTPVERPRTRAKAVRRMLELMAQRMGDSTLHVMVHHADELEDGQKLKEEISRQFKCSEVYLSEFTPAMGVHAGTGILAISFYKD